MGTVSFVRCLVHRVQKKEEEKDHTECKSCVIEYVLPVHWLCVSCVQDRAAAVPTVSYKTTLLLLLLSYKRLRTFFVHSPCILKLRCTHA